MLHISDHYLKNCKLPVREGSLTAHRAPKDGGAGDSLFSLSIVVRAAGLTAIMVGLLGEQHPHVGT